MEINETYKLKESKPTGYHWISDTTKKVFHYELSFIELYLKTLPTIFVMEDDE